MHSMPAAHQLVLRCGLPNTNVLAALAGHICEGDGALLHAQALELHAAWTFREHKQRAHWHCRCCPKGYLHHRDNERGSAGTGGSRAVGSRFMQAAAAPLSACRPRLPSPGIGGDTVTAGAASARQSTQRQQHNRTSGSPHAAYVQQLRELDGRIPSGRHLGVCQDGDRAM